MKAGANVNDPGLLSAGLGIKVSRHTHGSNATEVH